MGKVRYARDSDGVAHFIDREHPSDDELYVAKCGRVVPSGEVMTAESHEDIDHPRAVDCINSWSAGERQ